MGAQAAKAAEQIANDKGKETKLKHYILKLDSLALPFVKEISLDVLIFISYKP
jgi:hypothetical protein